MKIVTTINAFGILTSIKLVKEITSDSTVNNESNTSIHPVEKPHATDRNFEHRGYLKSFDTAVIGYYMMGLGD